MAYSICDSEKSEMSVFSLSQSDIQSVLDTLIDLPLSPPPSSSSSSSISSFCPPHTSFCQDNTDLCNLVDNCHNSRAKQNERRYSLSDYQHSPCDFQQQQQFGSGDRPLANVPLAYLLHSEVKLTPEALPAHLQLFSGNVGVVTHVNEVCWSISIYLGESPSPTKLCVGSNEAQHLVPVCPAEGDNVRVVKSQYAGREGRVNSCNNEREFLIELTDGSQIYVVNTDLVRLHDMRHLSVSDCTNTQVTGDSVPSRPTTLTPSGDTWNIGSLQIDSPMNCYGGGGAAMGYDHTPAPSPSDGSCMSPSSPWSVGYYPHTPHHHGNGRECPTSPVELPTTPTCTPCTSTTYYPTPTLAPPNYNYGSTPTVPTYCGVYPRHPFYNPRMYHYGMNPFNRLQPHMMTGYIPYIQRPPPPYQHRTNTPHSTSGYCSFLHQPVTTGCSQTGSLNQFSCRTQTSKSLTHCIPIYQTSSTCDPSRTKGCKINPLDELKALLCAESKQKGILSSKLCPGKSLTCEEIIAKVVDNICGIEPPQHWYNPNSKKNSCDELVTESVLVSAICPLTKQRMEYPCRGLNCTHLQCFDAKAFLQLALKRRSQTGSCKSLSSSSSHPTSGWKCPVCNKVVCPKQIFIEKHLKKVLESTDALELEYKDVGHWQPIERQSETTAPCVIDLTLESDDEL